MAKSGAENYSIVKTKSMFSLLKTIDEGNSEKEEYAIGCAGVILMNDLDYQGAQRVWRQITPVVIMAVQSAVVINHLANKKQWENK